MFGISFQKIMVLVAIVGAVIWFYRNQKIFFKHAENLKAKMSAHNQERTKNQASQEKSAQENEDAMQSLELCNVCNSYVVPGYNPTCHKANCPQNT